MPKIFSASCEDDTPRHRGRPRCSARNKSILEAATCLFMERGFDGTSMDAVAKEAGVSKQTVYSHFSNKESLFSAAITNKMEDYFPDREQFIKSEGSFEAELKRVAVQFSTLLMSADAMSVFRLLVSQAPRGPQLAEIFWQAGPKVMLEILTEFLDKWVKKGALKIDNLHEAAMLMINLLKGQLHFALSIGLVDRFTDEELSANADEAITNFLKIYGLK